MEIPCCTSATFKNTLPYVVGGALFITLLVVGILATLEIGPFASFAYTEVVSAVSYVAAALIVVGGVLYFKLCKCQWEKKEILDSDDAGYALRKNRSIILVHRSNSPPPEQKGMETPSVYAGYNLMGVNGNVSGRPDSLPVIDPYGLENKVLFLKTYSQEDFLRVAEKILGSFQVPIPETDYFDNFSCEEFLQDGGTAFQYPLAYGKLGDGWFIAANYVFKVQMEKNGDYETVEDGVIAFIARHNNSYVHWHSATLRGTVKSSYDQTDPVGILGRNMNNNDFDMTSNIFHAFVNGIPYSGIEQGNDGTWYNLEYTLKTPPVET